MNAHAQIAVSDRFLSDAIVERDRAKQSVDALIAQLAEARKNPKHGKRRFRTPKPEWIGHGKESEKGRV